MCQLLVANDSIEFLVRVDVCIKRKRNVFLNFFGGDIHDIGSKSYF